MMLQVSLLRATVCPSIISTALFMSSDLTSRYHQTLSPRISANHSAAPFRQIMRPVLTTDLLGLYPCVLLLIKDDDTLFCSQPASSLCLAFPSSDKAAASQSSVCVSAASELCSIPTCKPGYCLSFVSILSRFWIDSTENITSSWPLADRSLPPLEVEQHCRHMVKHVTLFLCPSSVCALGKARVLLLLRASETYAETLGRS